MGKDMEYFGREIQMFKKKKEPNRKFEAEKYSI